MGYEFNLNPVIGWTSFLSRETMQATYHEVVSCSGLLFYRYNKSLFVLRCLTRIASHCCLCPSWLSGQEGMAIWPFGSREIRKDRFIGLGHVFLVYSEMCHISCAGGLQLVSGYFQIVPWLARPGFFQVLLHQSLRVGE